MRKDFEKLHNQIKRINENSYEREMIKSLNQALEEDENETRDINNNLETQVQTNDTLTTPITKQFLDLTRKSEVDDYRIWLSKITGKPIISNVGARGQYQFMPDTWTQETKKLYGKSLPFKMADNKYIAREVAENYYKNTIEKYLSQNLKGYDDFPIDKKQELLIASYNGGIGHVVRKKGIFDEMFKETRNHVRKFRDLRKG